MDLAVIPPRQVLAAQCVPYITTHCELSAEQPSLLHETGRKRHHAQPPSLEAPQNTQSSELFLGPQPRDQHHAQGYMESHFADTVGEQ